MITNMLRLTVALCALISLNARGEQLWLKHGRASEQAAALLTEMRHADVYGLTPSDYAIDLSAADVSAVLSGSADVRELDRFEASLSTAVARFIRELHGGRVQPASAGFYLPANNDSFDAALAVRQLAFSDNVATTLASFEPAPLPYARLKAALAKYRGLAAQPTLTDLPPLPGRALERGDEYAGAPQLRTLLRSLDDLPSHSSIPSANERVIDAELETAVRNFQRRHGLTIDGIVGPRTFAALSTPLTERVVQLELSMERWRWLSSMSRPNIVINIPEFMLFALPLEHEPSSTTLEMRVIVGESRAGAQTPVFTSRITQVVFQPYWDVPRGILLRELLPRIRKDRSFLDRYDMEIVRGNGDDARVLTPTAAAIDALAAGNLRLRQRPGAKNALGPVKFVMLNPFNVYLHATPEQALFDRTQRTFSHGCIRVSAPRALARYVLRNAREAWDDAAIDAALCRADTLRVSLKRPVDVIVFYATAVATQSQGVLFFEDVYGHDRRLRQLLSHPPST